MDTSGQRNNIMVKIVTLTALLTTAVGIAEPLTNATSLVGIALTANEVLRLPSCDASTPDTVFLGTVKALQTGNLRELYYHFEPNYLYGLTGYCNSLTVPAETVASFRSVMMDSNFSNIVITAYSISTSNQFVRITASLRENYTSRTLTEPLTLMLGNSTNGWKVVAYDDDKWDK